MYTAQLHRRISTPKQTLGDFYLFDDNELVFVCKTLELPWKDNAKQISCIPPKTYPCILTHSPRFNRDLYLVTNVEGRTGIRLHPGNYYTQILGCILVGDALKDINLDQELDVVHSGKTHTQLLELLDGEPFTLEIYDFT